MLNLQAVSGQRLYRLIAERIAEKIRSGEFPAGARLPAERDLADGLQVSRSSVREALIALELSGYIEVRIGSGVYVRSTRCIEGEGPMVAPPGAARDIAGNGGDFGPFELLATRLLIEPECAALAAQNGTGSQLAKIRDLQEASSKTGAHEHHDRTFHASIAAACGNAVLEIMISHVWDLSEASSLCERLDRHLVDTEVWDVALHEHGHIAQAILERDPMRAYHTMHAHLAGIVTRLREDFAGQHELATLPSPTSEVHQVFASR